MFRYNNRRKKTIWIFEIDLIYVCGGFDGSTRLASTECYDEKTDVWTIGEDMHVGREGAGLVAIGDHLYCIGGYDGLNLLQTVEKYGKTKKSEENI